MPKDFSKTRRFHAVRRILFRLMFLNLLVAMAKIIVGFTTNTLSMIADGFHSLLDFASNIVGLVGATVGAQPPDECHPYGHHKYETLASLIIGILVLYTGIEIVREATLRLFGDAIPTVGWLNIAVMVGTLFVNIGISTYEMRAAKRFKSEILAADALQTRSDVFVSSGVLIALFGVWAGYHSLDAIAAMFVTIAVFYSAWLIFRRASGILSDSMVIDPGIIEAAAMEVDGVQSVEKIRSRGTEDRLSVDMHIRVDPDISVLVAHEITHKVKEAVQNSTGAEDVVIHTEPQGPPSLNEKTEG